MSTSNRTTGGIRFHARAIVMAIALLAVGSTQVAAAGPRATFPCMNFAKLHKTGIVSCQLNGTKFHASEQVSVTYRLEIDWKQGSKNQQKVVVYHHSSSTDRHGTFKRPPLQFKLPAGNAVRFAVQVTLVGTRGDHVTVITRGSVH